MMRHLPLTLALVALGCGNTVVPEGSGGAAPATTSSTSSTTSSGASSSSGCIVPSCPALGLDCGMADDGCGGILDCGTCPSTPCGTVTCGGGGLPNVCGGPTCCPKTCAQLGFNCGVAGDGCGGVLDCGTCAATTRCGAETCGGGGIPNVCGHLTTCCPDTCAHKGFDCGLVGDGCGNTLDCGACPAGKTCGGGGPNVCG